MNNIEIKTVEFNQYFAEIKKIRTDVFIKEQNVPINMEWDEFDNDSIHILAYYDSKAVATARLLPDGHIGRMSVLKAYRRRNIGEQMIKYLLKLAKKNAVNIVSLSAQKHAVGFYEKYGFITISEIYLDAGIPHYDMQYIDSIDGKTK